MSQSTPDATLTADPLAAREIGIDGLLCIDLEDWHQIMLRKFDGRPRYCQAPFRRGLEALLNLFAEQRQVATFFVLGMTAEADPGIVRDLVDAGHEVATHGHAHIHLERRTLAEFREDIRRAKGQLEEMVGRPVLGHRAPEFSVPRDNPSGFFDVLLEEGIRYDSSVFPVAMSRYGLPDMPRMPFRVGRPSGELVELPLVSVDWAGRRWPVAGGGYWRILPGWAIRRLLARARRQGVLLTLYLHNYEFDPRRLTLEEVAEADQLSAGWAGYERKQNLRRRSMSGKLRRVIGEFRFSGCEHFLREQGWLTA